MKLSLSFATACMGILILVTGCGKTSHTDTTKLSSSFQGAPADRKSSIDAAAKAIQSGDFAAAADSLKKAVKGAQLSPEQKTAVSEMVAEMQKIASQDSDKYPLEVYYAIGEVITVMEGLPVVRRQTSAPPTP
ncbi:MAG: hypothetical protein O2960_09730 [Verrucomicrobia bacterium]|nr:hypothetical protein [Verrucomicrobiota bacterium]